MIRFFDSRGDYTLKNGNVRALLGMLGALGVKVVDYRHMACFALAI